jgi:FtsP/CotA-like multicopper oxidase with cupredoxin domain
MSTLAGYGAYLNQDATDTDDTGPGSPVIETTLIASKQDVTIAPGIAVHAEVLNGGIPGPTFRLNVGDSVVVRLVNLLDFPLGIHWHGVELENYSDGTEITQNPTVPKFAVPPPPPAPAGGTFLYKFKVPRAGLFWYHPHHGNSINRLFRGLYGLIIVTDPALEAASTGLPADTLQLVLSDITACKAVGSNDASTYADPSLLPVADRPEWLMLGPPFAQTGPSPADLCEITGSHSASDDDGNPAASPYNAGDVPSIMRMPPPPTRQRLNEGQTVLTNGVNAGLRKGTPAAPKATLEPGAVSRNVQSGQGLRLQILNSAHVRYFRLRLTAADGTQVPLLRIGGEGGLLNNAIQEGGTLGGVGGIDTLFNPGEILLPSACRADVVAAIPPGLPAGSILTLWTRDYQRTGASNPGNWAQIPTVPVAHFTITGPAGSTYTLNPGDAIRPVGTPVDVGPVTGAPDSLLDPAAIGRAGQGSSNVEIKFQTGGEPSIDGLNPVPPAFMGSIPYTDAPYITTTRYAPHGNLLELQITNTSGAHHPFHLHGFSFKPIKIVPRTGGSGTGTVNPWPYDEFRDTIDLLPDYTLTIRVRLTDRNLADDSTPGGALGRWLFHCHIFFHHMHGMISELVVTDGAGKEKPNVNVGGSWVFAPIGGTATRNGTFHHSTGLNITSLIPTKGTLVPIPALPSPAGTWSWSYTPVAGDPAFNYVYVTATDSDGRKDQCVFRLQNGGNNAGSDIGDPHIHTVDGKAYDFQAAGEFALLRDLEGMEIQARQTPAVTPPPVTDGYTGLTECVSLNSAVAARVGSHRISYQPWREPRVLQFFLDGKPADLPQNGIDLDGHLVTTFAASGQTGIRVDYAHGPVLKVTPLYWSNYGIWHLDVDVSNTQADQGIMARIPKGTWLPLLPSGATVGPMPASLHDRYVTLYKTFADAWRITDATSLFEYLPWKTTASYTDKDWPPQKPPCTHVKPGFPLPLHPIRENIPIEKARQICQGVKSKDLFENCVFDVATTGDESLAKGYLIAQGLRERGTAVQLIAGKTQIAPGEKLLVTAIVLPRTQRKPAPTGRVTFVQDGVPVSLSPIDEHGRARFVVANLKPGDHKIRADYSGDAEYDPSSSPNLLLTVGRGEASKTGGAAYSMRGTFYEACDCNPVCPCWIGDAPDGGQCTGVFAWEIEEGSIDGVDVGGLKIVSVSQHRGPREEGGQRVMIFVDDAATRQKTDALAAAFSGRLGGPLQELGDLLGELLGVERAPITLRREGRLTKLTVDRQIRVEGTTNEGPSGRPMTLNDGKLSTVLGTPAAIGESGRFVVKLAAQSMDVDVRGRSTTSGRFSYENAAGDAANVARNVPASGGMPMG